MRCSDNTAPLENTWGLSRVEGHWAEPRWGLGKRARAQSWKTSFSHVPRGLYFGEGSGGEAEEG
jgi:hypothetical protein